MIPETLATQPPRTLSLPPKLRHTQDWERFAQRTWEQSVVLYDMANTPELPSLSESDLFNAVVGCVQDFLKGHPQKVRLYVNNNELDLSIPRHQQLLPQAIDFTFEGYHQRISVDEDLADYALIIADWHQFSRSSWEKILHAVQGLTQWVGMSNARMDTQIFIGNYKTTPFGVHQDPMTGFHFPVIGHKTMRFWPHQQVMTRPGLRGAQDYQAFIEGSTVCTAYPGQVMYWPSSEWHVAESRGDFSVTWSFGYWLADAITTRTLNQLADLLTHNPCTREPLHRQNLCHEASQLHQLKSLLNKISNTVNGADLFQSLCTSWLEQFSASGYLRYPARLTYLPAHHQSLKLKPVFQVLSYPLDEQQLIVAAAGYSKTFPNHPVLHAVIDTLNANGSVHLSPSDWHHHEVSPEPLIEFLHETGVLFVHQSW